MHIASYNMRAGVYMYQINQLVYRFVYTFDLFSSPVVVEVLFAITR